MDALMALYLAEPRRMVASMVLSMELWLEQNSALLKLAFWEELEWTRRWAELRLTVEKMVHGCEPLLVLCSECPKRMAALSRKLYLVH